MILHNKYYHEKTIKRNFQKNIVLLFKTYRYLYFRVLKTKWNGRLRFIDHYSSFVCLLTTNTTREIGYLVTLEINKHTLCAKLYYTYLITRRTRRYLYLIICIMCGLIMILFVHLSIHHTHRSWFTQESRHIQTFKVLIYYYIYLC